MTATKEVDGELERIVRRLWPDATVESARAFGTDEASGSALQLTAKAAGYGVPVLLEVRSAGRLRKLVLHGTSANQFGHDRRADRAAEMLLAADTFSSIPRHAPVLDVGAFRMDGSSVSLRDTGELYLLTEFVDGKPYADDLRRIAQSHEATADDVARVTALAHYLVELHTSQPDLGGKYQRSLRDLLGSGEGIFGIVDGYPAETPGAPRARLEALEEKCLAWRWRLKQRAPRLARIHGDFHPFNVVFDGQSQLHVLDASRGSLGDAADDVTCMAVNFVFFALQEPGAWRDAFSGLWREFWQQYERGAADPELFAVAAPFLTWRLLVLACPVWYPNLSADARGRLLSLAEASLSSERFQPALADEVFR